MSKSAGFPQRVADLFRQNALPAQVMGLALAVGGLAGLWWLAPANLAAQMSAPLLGVALIAFAQFFHALRKIKPEERRSLEAAGVCCFGVCLAATLGVTGYHYHHGAGRSPPGGGGGGAVSSGGAGAADTEVTFAGDEPNRLVIRVPVKNPTDVIVEVEKVWVLTPDNAPPETLDWPLADVELPAEQSLPYKVKAISGTAVPIEITLVPLPPNSSADPVQVENRWVTRLKFTKPPPKDYVYLLKVAVVTKQGKTVSAGSVVYFPDLKTKYDKLTGANQEALREIAAVQAPKSPKLAELLSDRPRTPDPQKKSPPADAPAAGQGGKSKG